MTGAEVSSWVSNAIAATSLIVSIVALRKSNANSNSIKNIEARIAQSAIHQPMLFGGGGGGGSGGGAGGHAIYNPSQVVNGEGAFQETHSN